MSFELIFRVVNISVIPFWLILFFLPKWRFRNDLIYVSATVLATLYTALIAFGSTIDIGDFSNLEGVKNLFTSDEAVLIGWIHYLAFDLLIGNWMVNQAQELKIRHIILSPCLIFTFMFGPVGYLLFTLLKISKIGRTN